MTLDIELTGSNGRAGDVIRLRASGVVADEDRRWCFGGALDIAGNAAPMSARSAYHGVFRSGDTRLAWLTLDVDSRHPAGRVKLACELSFGAPAEPIPTITALPHVRRPALTRFHQHATVA